MTASRMTRHNIRAGLYAPLRVYVYEEDGCAYVQYDLPSSLFGIFGDDHISKVGKELDEKLFNVIQLADAL